MNDCINPAFLNNWPVGSLDMAIHKYAEVVKINYTLVLFLCTNINLNGKSILYLKIKFLGVAVITPNEVEMLLKLVTLE